MSDLLASWNQLEVAFSEAFEAYGDGGNLVFAFLPIDRDAPDIGPMTITGELPLSILPDTTWPDPWGSCLLTDHAGQPHRIFIVAAGTNSSAEPYRAFSRLARRAGAACFRLPRGMAATGPGNAPEMNWLGTLYSYLKGTEFVVEGPGFSRLRSVFAASVEVLSLINRGDVNGNAPSYTGSLRPGIPGVEGELRFELAPLDSAAHDSTPCGGLPPPPPNQVREWLANRYQSVPVAERGNGPNGEPAVFERLESLTEHLRGAGEPEQEVIAACATAGWLTDAIVTVQDAAAAADFPPEVRRLRLTPGRHELIVILPAVLNAQRPVAKQPRHPTTTPPVPTPSAPPPQARENGPFEPFGFRWGDVEGEFLKDERRYYRLLIVVWPTFRLRTPLHYNKANEEIMAADGTKLSLKSLRNYARDLSNILTERFKFPTRLELDEHYLCWRDLPDAAPPS